LGTPFWQWTITPTKVLTSSDDPLTVMFKLVLAKHGPREAEAMSDQSAAGKIIRNE
jgi:hypothetical protein